MQFALKVSRELENVHHIFWSFQTGLLVFKSEKIVLYYLIAINYLRFHVTFNLLNFQNNWWLMLTIHPTVRCFFFLSFSFFQKMCYIYIVLYFTSFFNSDLQSWVLFAYWTGTLLLLWKGFLSTTWGPTSLFKMRFKHNDAWWGSQ